jgi:hypothetical protein
MQLAQVVARALVVLLIAIAVPAASLGANMALRPLPKNPLLFQVPFRGTFLRPVGVQLGQRTGDQFPRSSLLIPFFPLVCS